MMTEKNLLVIVVKNKSAKESDNILFLMLKDQNCEYLF
jgi:thioredoxin-related protein